jgi:acetyl esterase/lipase
MQDRVDINRVHPELRNGLNMMPGGNFTREMLPVIRKMGGMPLQAVPEDPSIKIYNRLIPGPKDAPEVRVRIYEPLNKQPKAPGILYIHGGGYIVGTPEMTDGSCIYIWFRK